jgi:hypothetical protein
MDGLSRHAGDSSRRRAADGQLHRSTAAGPSLGAAGNTGSECVTIANLPGPSG